MTKPTIQNLRHGALVRDNRGRLSLVTEIHYAGCTQSADWIKGQSIPVTTKELKGPWLDCAPLDGGAIHIAMSRCEIVLDQEQVADVLRNHLVEKVEA